MSEWIGKCETILTAIGLPYRMERMTCPTAQLPDTYITYFLVVDNDKAWANNAGTSHVSRIQVSLFYRNNNIIQTVPDQIEAAFIAANFMRGDAGRIPHQNDTGHYGWRRDFRYYEGR
ncbi:MAG: hypothetical protein VB078_00440 [Clostridiaceae bacterium]|nr:hypothetical protein [Clostridiaceae bacterium]